MNSYQLNSHFTKFLKILKPNGFAEFEWPRKSIVSLIYIKTLLRFATELLLPRMIILYP